jgi:ATP-dependent DNA helicase DinG
VAGEYFGLECSNYRYDELTRDAEQTLRQKDSLNAGLMRAIKRLHEDSQLFFSLFPATEGRSGFDQRERWVERNFDQYSALQNALMRLRGELSALAEKPEEIHTLMGRIEELRGDITFLLESKDKRFVHWYERRGRGLYLQATPIDVAPILTERLFEAVETIVLTSATLAVGGNFDFVKARLGIRRAEEVILEPQFDYANQSLLYLPPEMPEPNDPAFLEAAVEQIVRIINISRGRAFALFTSNQQMRLAHDRVKQLLSRAPGEMRYPLLLQGTAPKRVLLEQFQSDEMAGAVLFATSSFWQGVDVPGEKLSAVIIDRLPFAVPSDPVVKARVESLRDGGGNPFYDYQVPDAVIALKQGFGRLIRSRSDRGVLALLDPRIRTKGYGKVFLESLPAYRTTRELGDVEQMFSEMDRRSKTGRRKAE